MTSSTDTEQSENSATNLGRGLLFGPNLAFWCLATIFLGAAAWVSSTNMVLQSPVTDIWQHYAALRELMADLRNPDNPFVITEEGSRHFHPLWVVSAALAQVFDLTAWQILRLASFVSMAILGTGIFFFARTIHPSPWAPLMLLLTMLFAWAGQVEHTGFHSLGSLMYTAPYPATFLIGFSLILWVMSIRALENVKYAIAIFPFAAFMFTTHQLGAVIGIVGAGCFALFWPADNHKTRMFVILALLAGVALSTLWPYHNPVALVLQPGNSNWAGGPNFYSPIIVLTTLSPAIIGVLGLKRKRERPLLLLLLAFVCLYLVGVTGAKVAGRFVMPITLVLHVGLVIYVLELAKHPMMHSDRTRNLTIVGAVYVLFVFFVTVMNAHAFEEQGYEKGAYQAAIELTRDIPDEQPVATWHVTAWPVVASGTKVLSIPWPEPAISDLAERQATTLSLFQYSLSKEELIALARQAGVRTLIVDERSVLPPIIPRLTNLAAHTRSVPPLWRFDLYD